MSDRPANVLVLITWFLSVGEELNRRGTGGTGGKPASQRLSSRLGFPRCKRPPPPRPPRAPRGQKPSLPSNGRRETLARTDTLNLSKCTSACLRVCVCVRKLIKAGPLQPAEREAVSRRAVCAVTLLTHVSCRNPGRPEKQPAAPRD